MKNLKFKYSIVFLLTAVIILLLPSSFLLYMSFSDYKPESKQNLSLENKNDKIILDEKVFTLLSWNIGYCGLGKEMDFFYDGGKKVRSEKKQAELYKNQIINFIDSLKNIDFWFFQEVDVKSKRSYFVDQRKELKKCLKEYNSAFATNYKVAYVPIPFLKAMGKVKAGIMNFSRFLPNETFRVSYPNIASWPKNLFLLDRCFMMFRYLLPSGKDLVLINTHNSYYVVEDSLKMIELNILKRQVIEEYEKGNFVVIGGDWNQLPSGYHKISNLSSELLQKNITTIPETYLPKKWKYAFDPNVPTNRDLIEPYKKNQTKISIIDFFIVSPNVEIKNCKTYSLNFENSDHNPIQLTFSLIE